MTESNVKSHLMSAFSKLGVITRNAAAEMILDHESGLGPGSCGSPRKSEPRNCRTPGTSYNRARRARSSVGERSLHTREVAGSSPAVPIKIPANVQFWLSHKISRASRERSLVRAHPCPYWKALVTPGLFVSTRGCWGHRQGSILACGTPGKVCGSSTCSTCGASVRHTRVERGRAPRASRTSVGRWILCGADNDRLRRLAAALAGRSRRPAGC